MDAGHLRRDAVAKRSLLEGLFKVDWKLCWFFVIIFGIIIKGLFTL